MTRKTLARAQLRDINKIATNKGKGVYRRGVGAESQCPINRKEVYEGNGYCYMFKSQESEDKG